MPSRGPAASERPQEAPSHPRRLKQPPKREQAGRANTSDAWFHASESRGTLSSVETRIRLSDAHPREDIGWLQAPPHWLWRLRPLHPFPRRGSFLGSQPTLQSLAPSTSLQSLAEVQFPAPFPSGFLCKGSRLLRMLDFPRSPACSSRG